jgi:purine-cytosine permease-like protein
MAQAVTALTRLDIHLSYVVVSAVMIPLTLYGMSFSARFRAWTWPVWIALIGLALGTAATAPEAGHKWCIRPPSRRRVWLGCPRSPCSLSPPPRCRWPPRWGSRATIRA